jgi:hypothetical protein
VVSSAVEFDFFGEMREFLEENFGDVLFDSQVGVIDFDEDSCID